MVDGAIASFRHALAFLNQVPLGIMLELILSMDVSESIFRVPKVQLPYWCGHEASILETALILGTANAKKGGHKVTYNFVMRSTFTSVVPVQRLSHQFRTEC
ncbi:hypothetical protein RHMOL_Rhmol05G0109200 [Rhododendron molle]|uniref:Uncharacterized protein n=1 Tax=Rhododendron molle TaxID=49168 RepID=A0ACC0NNX2_RHOML|nr:hypothetical protein RHMOL_Rhmol05G0109200 [Rhododendron molle]